MRQHISEPIRNVYKCRFIYYNNNYWQIKIEHWPSIHMCRSYCIVCCKVLSGSWYDKWFSHSPFRVLAGAQRPLRSSHFGLSFINNNHGTPDNRLSIISSKPDTQRKQVLHITYHENVTDLRRVFHILTLVPKWSYEHMSLSCDTRHEAASLGLFTTVYSVGRLDYNK